jgi:hypothetical protein
MRTKEEVQKMLGRAVNATPFLSNAKKYSLPREQLWTIVHVLNWVLVDDVVDCDLTAKLAAHIDQLEAEGKPRK